MTHNQQIAKKFKPRNSNVVKLYRTGDYSIIDIGRKYKVCAERIRQILVKEIGKEEMQTIKEMRRLRTAERLKEAYINRI